MRTEVPIALSNRHVHLTKEAVDILFGKDYTLTHKSDLSQPGQYAAVECIDIQGPKGTIPKVRVLGPERSACQVEILASDSFKLGVPIVIRDSGDLDGTPGCTLIGPAGTLEIAQGVIVATRHIHMNLKEAEEFGVKDGDKVKLVVPGERGLTFDNVLIRAKDTYALECHVDTEEGNAAGAKNGMICQMIR